jgi:molybdenum cofactor cytidylyltransferase
VNGEPRIGGLVMAAGGGRRFGGAKQLADVGGRPLLEHAIRAIVAVPAIDPVVVVLGAHADEILAGVDFHGVDRVVCDDWEAGLGVSLRCGIAALGDVDEVAVVLGDQPFITPQAIAGILDTPRSYLAARATYAGRPGHPVLLRRALLARAGELTGDAGFRELLAGARVRNWECGHLCDPIDVDTHDDLEVVRR